MSIFTVTVNLNPEFARWEIDDLGTSDGIWLESGRSLSIDERDNVSIGYRPIEQFTAPASEIINVHSNIVLDREFIFAQTQPWFPDILDKCLQRSYSYKDHQKQTAITTMESGRTRRRQLTKNIPSGFNVEFIFTQEQLGVFEYFNIVELEDMTLLFTIVLRTGYGLSPITVKHSAPPNIVKQGDVYRVVCKLEVQKRTIS